MRQRISSNLDLFKIISNLDAERGDKEKTLKTYLKYGESVFSEIDEALR
ncbi:MAG: hypothetical protein PHX25_00265 [Candidatus Pacebacteria bacterium]|nr:hypothetical protein [Candidatus Paceibacterota bacterium]